MMLPRPSCTVFGFLLAAGIGLGTSAGDRRGGSRKPPPNFKLVCDSADTDKKAELFCVRIDTRNGDIKRINLSKLPVSGTPTKSTIKAPGTYKVVCRASSTATRADFRCLRLDTGTGELQVVKLPGLGMIPE
jgi:hypothetical protein